MQQLEPKDYARARGVLQALNERLPVPAILAGEVPEARVFVDDGAHPQVALAWRKNHLYLAGSPGNAVFNEDMRRLLDETIGPNRRAAGSSMFELFYAPHPAGSPWEGVIEQMLNDRAPVRGDRQCYVCSEPPPAGWRDALPHGFALRPVDDRLLGERQLKNLDILKSEMCSERASVEEFLARSFGTCVVDAGEIVSWCLSEYNLGPRCEVGIETGEAYQRRGLGTLVARALVERALAQGYTHIGWDCWADNQASVATALKAGFRKVSDYPVYFARYDAAADPAS